MSTRRNRIARALLLPHLAQTLTLAAAAVAMVIGLAIGHGLPVHFVEEGGPVESATLWAYLAAVLGTVVLRWPGLPWRDVAATCTVLLAMAAREADLHTSMYGISILKSRFYLDASPARLSGAAAVLVPVAVAAAALGYRHGRRWLQPRAAWSVATTTVALMAGVMVAAKMLDRGPDVLAAVTGDLPATVLHVMQSLEEVLEFCLPWLALLAMAQGSATACHRSDGEFRCCPG